MALGKSSAMQTQRPVDPAGYKAQNNTQSVFTDQDSRNRFQTELIAEHVIAQKQAAQSAGGAKTPAARK